MKAKDGKWGPWTYDAKRKVLTHDIDNTYEIDVEEIEGNPEELADWLAQLAEKSWMDATAMGHFVYALDEVINLRAVKVK